MRLRFDHHRAVDPVGGTWPWVESNATTRLRYILYAVNRERDGIEGDVDRLGEAVLQIIGSFWDCGAPEGLVNGQSRDVRVTTFYCASDRCSGHTRPLASRRVARPATGPAEGGGSLPDETLGARVENIDGSTSYLRPTSSSTELYTEHQYEERSYAVGGEGLFPCEVSEAHRYDPQEEREQGGDASLPGCDRTRWLTEDRTQVLEAVSKGGQPGPMCHYRPWEFLMESRGCCDDQREWIDRVPAYDIERRWYGRRMGPQWQRGIVDEFPPEGCPVPHTNPQPKPRQGSQPEYHPFLCKRPPHATRSHAPCRPTVVPSMEEDSRKGSVESTARGEDEDGVESDSMEEGSRTRSVDSPARGEDEAVVENDPMEEDSRTGSVDSPARREDGNVVESDLDPAWMKQRIPRKGLAGARWTSYPQRLARRPWELLERAESLDQERRGWERHPAYIAGVNRERAQSLSEEPLQGRRSWRGGTLLRHDGFLRAHLLRYPGEDVHRYEEYLLDGLSWPGGTPGWPDPGGSEGFVASDIDQGAYYPRLELLQESTSDPSADSWNGELPPRADQQGARLVGEAGSAPMPRVEIEFGNGLDYPHLSPNYYQNHPQEAPLGEEERAAREYDPRYIPLMDRVRRGREDDYHVVHPNWHEEVLVHRQGQQGYEARRRWAVVVMAEEGSWHGRHWAGSEDNRWWRGTNTHVWPYEPFV